MNSSDQKPSVAAEEMPGIPPAPRKRAALRFRRHAPPTAPRAVRRETAPIQSGFRAVIGLLALVWTLYSVYGDAFSVVTIGAALTASLILIILRAVPAAWTRERPLTFTAPVVFALALWMGAGIAALASLAAAFLYARFGPPAGRSRPYLRFQGAQLALSAFVGIAALSAAEQALRHFSPSSPAGSALPALSIVALTALGALAFTLTNALLTTLANFGALRAEVQAADARARFGGLALVYMLGMLPVVLLSPLGRNLGLVVAFPLCLLLLLCALTARLTVEVTSLRGQLETAEAMGRASVADSETEVEPAALLHRFLLLAQGLVSADRALVWIMNQETGELTPTAALPSLGRFAEQKALFGEGLIGHAAARYSPRVIADAGRDAHRGHREVAYGAWLLYPIVVHERLLGVAHWIRPVGRPFTPEDTARLASLVPQAAVALENVRVRESMHNLASTDGLTGLYNHRRMHDLLREEMRRATRYHRALSVLMLDVDSFKTFNDTYGHPQGDQLLRGIASILRANVRTVDYVGRYGGEEFLVLLPETSKDDACRMAERIRSSVEEQAFIVIEGRAIRRTVSVGVAAYPEDALNPSELVQRADEALYRAKRAGKNRVLWA